MDKKRPTIRDLAELSEACRVRAETAPTTQETGEKSKTVGHWEGSEILKGHQFWEVVDAHGVGARLRYRTEAEAREKLNEVSWAVTVQSVTGNPDFQCQICKGVNIDGTAWVDLFDNRETGDEPPSNDVYCNDCETDTGSEDFEALLQLGNGNRVSLGRWAMTPIWEKHDCEDCRFLGALGSIDVYECFAPAVREKKDPLSRSFVIRSGPLPNGGLAYYSPRGMLAINPPENVSADEVMDAIIETMSRTAP